MKKYTKLAYIAILLIVLLFAFIIYNTTTNKKKSEENLKTKAISEMKYLENKFENLFNEMNNISFENYKIFATEIKKEESEKESSSTSGSSDSSEKSSSGGESKQGGSQSSEGGMKNSEASESTEKNMQYKLEETGILTGNTGINWENVKNEVENMYTLLYVATIDLYKATEDQSDIINFNKEYDKLTQAVKTENKEETLNELSKLYEYLPKFAENIFEEEKTKTILKAKNEVFKAYTILEREDWKTISENVGKASQEFTKLVTNVNNKEKNQYNINKSYIIINELQEAIELKDKEIFLIKYKNLLEELKNI